MKMQWCKAMKLVNLISSAGLFDQVEIDTVP
jgi:hypothetical protein